VDILFAASDAAASGVGVVDPIAGIVGSASVRALGVGWALFNQRHRDDFLEDWLEDYVTYTAATDRLRSDVDQQREHQDEQRAGLDNIKETIAELRGSLGDAAYATINHIVEVVRHTAQEEKLAALKNAALHVALGDGPDQTLQDILVSLVDDLTVLHIRLLTILTDPSQYDALPMDELHRLKPEWGSIPMLIARYIPDFSRGELLELCLTDLINKELLAVPSADRDLRWSVAPRPWQLAHDFMAFINPPEEPARD
jgi:hypothetical protein